MTWYMVIGTVPGNLRTSKTRATRWSAPSPNEAARAFIYDNPEYDRCIVTCCDTHCPGEHPAYVYDRTEQRPAMVNIMQRR